MTVHSQEGNNEKDFIVVNLSIGKNHLLHLKSLQYFREKQNYEGHLKFNKEKKSKSWQNWYILQILLIFEIAHTMN